MWSWYTTLSCYQLIKHWLLRWYPIATPPKKMLAKKYFQGGSWTMFLGRAIAMASFSGDYSQTMRLGAFENGVCTKKCNVGIWWKMMIRQQTGGNRASSIFTQISNIRKVGVDSSDYLPLYYLPVQARESGLARFFSMFLSPNIDCR